VDSFAVITITHFYARGLPIDPEAAVWPQLWVFIASGYVFKLVIALLDTVPFYIGVHYLSRYLEIDPNAEHAAGEV
jgi:queuosine precursor transporter